MDVQAAVAVVENSGVNMEVQIRKLEQAEHSQTRTLWEEIFIEDTRAFLDYYYKVKTAGNQIYVAEDVEQICAMLQLNPYRIKLGEAQAICQYIIAVATRPTHRKRGIMAALLKRSMKEMEQKKEPFTFLMPAAEAIYYPFDFRYVYGQAWQLVKGEKPDAHIQVRKAGIKDCEECAQLAMHCLEGRYGTYAVRDTGYYETLLEEQKSQNGGIVIAERDNHIIGCMPYTKEEHFEIREPLFDDEYAEDLTKAVYYLTKDETTEVKCTGFGTERKPMIMARILHLESLLATIQVNGVIACTITVTDTIIDSNNGTFHIHMSAEEKVVMHPAQESESEGAISIAALTSFLFGYYSLEESLLKEGDRIPQGVQKELEKMSPISPLFLNEIV